MSNIFLKKTKYEDVDLSFSCHPSKHKGAVSNDFDCIIEFTLGDSGYRNKAVIQKPVNTQEEDAMKALAEAAVERLTPWAQEIINDRKTTAARQKEETASEKSTKGKGKKK